MEILGLKCRKNENLCDFGRFEKERERERNNVFVLLMTLHGYYYSLSIRLGFPFDQEDAKAVEEN